MDIVNLTQKQLGIPEKSGGVLGYGGSHGVRMTEGIGLYRQALTAHVQMDLVGREESTE